MPCWGDDVNRRPVGTKRERLDELATTTHGALCIGHLLGAHYHLTAPDRDTENWLCVGAHIAGAVFSAISVVEHARGEKP